MLSQVLTLLGITDPTEELEDKIQAIIDITEQRLKVLLGGIATIPEELEYIVVEVSIIRFNRLGSEGVASHNVQGESMAWTERDFSPYKEEIQAFLDAQEDPSTDRGRLTFI